MKTKLVYSAALLLLTFASATATSRAPEPKTKLQVIYREDPQQGQWNVYIFGTVCEEGKLTLHQPAEPRVEPLRIECVEPR
jgi:hypothetical protein